MHAAPSPSSAPPADRLELRCSGRRSRDLWLAIGGLAAGPIMAYEAFNNSRGLLINRVIELSPRGATWFYAAMAVLSVVSAVFFFAQLWSRTHTQRRVVVDRSTLIVPASRWPLSTAERIIPIHTIQTLALVTAPGLTTLRVFHDTGIWDVNATMLESRDAFRALLQALCEVTGLTPIEDLSHTFAIRPRAARARR